jgi:hypothetical protein
MGRKTIWSWPHIKGLLESGDFYCDMSLASGPRSLYRRITRHPYFRALLHFVTVSPENARHVLSYARDLAGSITGSARSEKDIALCSCVVVLSQTAIPGVDGLLRYLRTTSALALRLPSAVASICWDTSASTTQVRVVLSSEPQQGYAVLKGDQPRLQRNDFYSIFRDPGTPDLGLAAG